MVLFLLHGAMVAAVPRWDVTAVSDTLASSYLSLSSACAASEAEAAVKRKDEKFTEIAYKSTTIIPFFSLGIKVLGLGLETTFLSLLRSPVVCLIKYSIFQPFHVSQFVSHWHWVRLYNCIIPTQFTGQLSQLRPRLEHICCDPSTSTPVETIFSHGGLLVEPHKANISDQVPYDSMKSKCNSIF